jgi:hypothetical protein
MPKHAFKLKTSTLAILSDDQRTMVTIPANASVTLVVGDIHENGFVEVRYRDQVLIMFAEDLRTRGRVVVRTGSWPRLADTIIAFTRPSTTMPGRLAGIILFGVNSSSARADKCARSFCKSLIQISWNPGPTERLWGSGGFAFQP